MDLLWIVGTVAAIGPRVSDERGATYKYLEIYEKGGNLRRVTIVRASSEIAALLEEHAIGIFLFWSLPGERRLWCVDRADGCWPLFPQNGPLAISKGATVREQRDVI